VIVLVMGVSGSGKTTIGEALAEALGWKYLDADEYHPQANVDKMAAGIALRDADRWPWLDDINRALLQLEKEGRSAVLGCSALKEAYRRRLSNGLRDFRVVHLHGTFGLLEARVAARKHRYMPASLLQSQFDILEPPAAAISIDVAAPVPDSVAKIRRELGR
jgi:gluconokinase